MSLSDKKFELDSYTNSPMKYYYWEEDVKEFIKELKERAFYHYGKMIITTELIDKLAGEELI